MVADYQRVLEMGLYRLYIIHFLEHLVNGKADYTTFCILGIILIQERGIPIHQPVKWNDREILNTAHVKINIIELYNVGPPQL